PSGSSAPRPRRCAVRAGCRAVRAGTCRWRTDRRPTAGRAPAPYRTGGTSWQNLDEDAGTEPKAPRTARQRAESLGLAILNQWVLKSTRRMQDTRAASAGMDDYCCVRAPIPPYAGLGDHAT